MRGGVQLNLWAFPFVWTLLLLPAPYSSALRCQRTPEGRMGDRSPVDGRFFLKISGNADSYIPNAQYTVSLQGQRNSQLPSKFSGFLLVAEPDSRDPVSDSFVANQKQNEVGTFQTLGDSLTKYSEKCPNAITHSSSLPKSEVQALWTAPPTKSGCVTIKATLIEHHDIWFMDDGPLSKTLCENVQESFDMQPPIIAKCCACDEAKYEVTFEGLWSRHTHPKDFPLNEWLTRFSDVIGASHTADYRFWDYGRHASEGLKQLAEHGATRVLESELKAEVGNKDPESNHIRTIIKARGISYPNLAGKTFAVFRVDSRHHLMSLVSMINPSPDWIVGVSGLELCQPNCSWVESKVLNLYPWDVGTDSGPTYDSPDQPTNPRDVIRRIRTNFPNDPRSPFYDPSGSEMKPLARLYLSRQRLYEKSCDSNGVDGGEDDSEADPCAVSAWSEYTPCSVTCGKGHKRRQRWYRSQSRAESAGCTKKLSQTTQCHGARKHCRQGDRKRVRVHTGPNSKEEDDPNCPTTPWSDWMECSVTCGKGLRARIRKLLVNGEDQQDMAYSRVHTKRALWGTSRNEEDEENAGEEEYEEVKERSEREERCSHVPLVQEVECEGAVESCDITEADARRRGQFGGLDTENHKLTGDVPGSAKVTGDGSLSGYDGPTSPPHMRGNSIDDRSRERHGYGQNRGRINNNNNDRRKPGRYNGRESRYLDPQELIDNERRRGNDGNEEYGEVKVEEHVGQIKKCEVTPWSEWTPCSATCGRGFEQMSREIIQHPINGGRSCPKKLLRRRKCRNLKPCPHHQQQNNNNNNNFEDYNIEEDDDSYESMNPTWGPGNQVSNARKECILSNWSSWSPCTSTCGADAIRQRTRHIVRHPSNGGAPCGPRIERRNCDLMPCPF